MLLNGRVLLNVGEAVDGKSVGLVHLESINQLDSQRSLLGSLELDEHESRDSHITNRSP